MTTPNEDRYRAGQSNFQRAMNHPIARETPAPRESLPSTGLDLDSLLTSEGCVRIVMGVAAGIIGVLASLGLLAVLWHHDALLRATWADVRGFIGYLFSINDWFRI